MSGYKGLLVGSGGPFGQFLADGFGMGAFDLLEDGKGGFGKGDCFL